MLVIASLLGVAESYAPSLREWSQAIVRMPASMQRSIARPV